MDALDSPFHFERGRIKMFFEAKELVLEQFPTASDEAKMQLIASLVQAHSTLLAAEKIGDDIKGGLLEVAHNIKEAGEN